LRGFWHLLSQPAQAVLTRLLLESLFLCAQVQPLLLPEKN
jgi:hypothetical protein